MRRKSFHYFIKALMFFSKLMPQRLAVGFGAFIGFLGYYLAPSEHRERALDNLRKCLPEKRKPELRRIARKVFENQGKNFFEVLHYSRLSSVNIAEKVVLTGRENFNEALSKGRGAFMLAAHFGNWELLGAALALYGIPINATARRVYISELDGILNELRESKGIKVIMREESDSARGIFKALKRNEVVALIIDQNTRHVPGVYVDFFGRKAYTPSALAVLALHTGAPVLPGFIVREGYRHSIEIGSPIEIMNTGDLDSDVLENTKRFTKVIESYVRKYPEQWVWFHKRWD
jgi:KDO2-lipid IV(A) lauroyltransferase